MVISSQKSQGLEPDGEPCLLGFEDNNSGGGGSDGPGQEKEMAAFDAEKKDHNKNCGFMCKMKKAMSSAKEQSGGMDSSKEPPVTVESMNEQVEESARLKEQVDETRKIRIASEKQDAPKSL